MESPESTLSNKPDIEYFGWILGAQWLHLSDGPVSCAFTYSSISLYPITFIIGLKWICESQLSMDPICEMIGGELHAQEQDE